jgi:hypothetical protein
MKITLLLTFISLSTVLSAQSNFKKQARKAKPVPEKGDDNYNEYSKNITLFKQNTVKGFFLAGFSIPALLAGGTLTGIGGYYVHGGSVEPDFKKTAYYKGGIAAVVTGPVILASGIVMAIFGDKRIKQAIKNKREANEIRGYISIKPDTIHLGDMKTEANNPALTFCIDF